MKANCVSCFNRINTLFAEIQGVSVIFSLRFLNVIYFKAIHLIVSDLIQFRRKASNEGQENIIRGKGLLINFGAGTEINQPKLYE